MFKTVFHPPGAFTTAVSMPLRIRLREMMNEKTLRDGRDPITNPITQIEVAKAIDVAEGTLGSWARNSVEKLDKNMLVKLCRYFECRLDDLLQIED